MKDNNKTNYGNWVPKNILIAGYCMTAMFLIMAVLCGIVWENIALTVILGVLCTVLLSFSVYMHLCRNQFAFEKGGMMGKVHKYLLQHLDWDGEGTLLDIGCGAGALTIRCAKCFPKAKLTGMDYWGAEWNYAKKQCESNAKVENVAGRIYFPKGDAAKLDFPNEVFDAVVSNFVFHEVHTAKDKRDVVREALRVVKKGGVFSFQDMFSQQRLYGDMEDFVKQLHLEGITEIHYIGNVEKKVEFIPGFVTAPWMIKGMGIIYGRK